MDSHDTNDTEVTLAQSVAQNAGGLALFAFITAGVIALVQLFTSDQIAKNIATAQAKALYEIVPQEQIDNDLLNTTLDLLNNTQSLSINLLGEHDDILNAHVGIKDNEVHSFIFPVMTKHGYTTDIHLLVGVNINGSVAGVRIVDHKETPGLGDKIEIKKSDWVLDFNQKSLIKPNLEGWKVKKDGGEFDQFTGATITPRAIVAAVKGALEFYQKHKVQLLEQATTLMQNNDQTQQVKS